MTDGTDFTQFKIADLAGAADMLLKRKILVEGDAQVADNRRDESGFHSDRQRKGGRGFLVCLEMIRIIYVSSGFS